MTHLLFLIDDLDRCLPEKAVQMLESIKLFLDVPGCAFVLALDDEVVERGILHRYKEYVLNGNGNGNGNSVQVRPPITGSEYLEKIVHLPFRLPLPGMAEMERFLDSLPLFRVGDSETRPMRDKVRDLRGTEDSELSRGGLAWREPLRDLFLNAVPRVPRKVLRATELLELHLEMAKARGWDDCDPVTLGRLTLLQLFAPELYRYARLRYHSLLAKLADWQKSYPDHWRRDDFAEHLKKSVASDGRQGGAAGNNEAEKMPAKGGAIRERNNFHRFYCELLRLVKEARHARSAFEPLDVVVYGGQLREDIRDWEPCFSLMEERPVGGADVVASSSGESSAAVRAPASEVHATAASSKPPRPAYREATIPDRAEFLDLLFGSSAADWDSALTGDGVRGRVLDGGTFDALMERLTGGEGYSEFPVNLDWLERLTARLTPEQLKRLYRETGLRDMPFNGSYLRGLQVDAEAIPEGADLRFADLRDSALVGEGVAGVRRTPAQQPLAPIVPNRGHGDWVRSVAPLADGGVVSGSGDRTVKVWRRGEGGEWACEATRGPMGRWDIPPQFNRDLAKSPVSVPQSEGVLLLGAEGQAARLMWDRRVYWNVTTDRNGEILEVRVTPWRPERRWQTVEWQGKQVPADAELHRYTYFLCENGALGPAYLFPDLIDWVNDDQGRPRTLILRRPARPSIKTT